MQQIHNPKKRRPAILTEELEGEWLCDGLSEERILQLATDQFLAARMEAGLLEKILNQFSTPLKVWNILKFLLWNRTV